MSGAAYRERLRRDVESNRAELARLSEHVPTDRVRALIEGQQRALQRSSSRFDGRAARGCIVEAHGDLRPEHICLETDRPAPDSSGNSFSRECSPRRGPFLDKPPLAMEPSVIDCLEFNRDFRTLDSAAELAFLKLECDRLGGPGIGEAIVETCRAELDDRPPSDVVQFYRSLHACTRAKVALWHLGEDGIDTPQRWTERARRYLELAEGGSERG